MGTASTLSHLDKLATDLLQSMKEYIEVLEGHMPESISALDTYVNGRQIPSPSSTGDEYDEIAHSIIMLGSALELKPKENALRYNDEFMPAWAYKDKNPLQELLNKAECYMELDFKNTRYRDEFGKPIDVFTLDDLSAMSSLKITTIRNATSVNGDLATIHLDHVFDVDENRLTQKVFVEHEAARRWLQKKNAYTPLRNLTETQERFINKIAKYGPNFDGKKLPDFLMMSEQDELITFYAPFEHVNAQAKVVLCGITPGAQQAEIALNTLANALDEGVSVEEALSQAKATASFAGPMRTSLIKMLNHVGLQHALHIQDCEELFNEQSHLVHYTSALRNPVFFRGQNYTGNPLMLKELTLRHQIDVYLSEEVELLGPNVLYIPLGPKPATALLYLAEKGALKKEQILDGIPHPSGANAERIKYFCEEKKREDLSSKTNADALDTARASVRHKIEAYSKNNQAV